MIKSFKEYIKEGYEPMDGKKKKEGQWNFDIKSAESLLTGLEKISTESDSSKAYSKLLNLSKKYYNKVGVKSLHSSIDNVLYEMENKRPSWKHDLKKVINQLEQLIDENSEKPMKESLLGTFSIKDMSIQNIFDNLYEGEFDYCTKEQLNEIKSRIEKEYSSFINSDKYKGSGVEQALNSINKLLNNEGTKFRQSTAGK